MSERKTSPYLKEWKLGELLSEFRNVGDTRSPIHSEVQAAIQAKLTDQLADSIDRHERAATRLTRQLFVLNIVLGVFTVSGTVLTIIAFMRAT